MPGYQWQEQGVEMQAQANHKAVRDVLEQGLLFLERVHPQDYARPLAGSFGGTPGAHYRHVLDHFECLLEGVESGQVNYDQRRRDPILESSLEEARRMTIALLERLYAIPQEALRRKCTVTYRVGYGDDPEQTAPSYFAREVMFCVGHAIHHYAILKLLCTEAGVALPREFGVAPSTLKHLESTVGA